jgi:hypothetical protein
MVDGQGLAEPLRFHARSWTGGSSQSRNRGYVPSTRRTLKPARVFRVPVEELFVLFGQLHLLLPKLFQLDSDYIPDNDPTIAALGRSKWVLGRIGSLS